MKPPMFKVQMPRKHKHLGDKEKKNFKRRLRH